MSWSNKSRLQSGGAVVPGHALSNTPMKEFCSPSREALHQTFISLPGA